MDFRPATAADKDSIIALIDAVYHEYGDRICLENADADLLDIPANYESGLFMALDNEGQIAGTVALTRDPDRPTVCLIKRLYLAPGLRGTGWGQRLIEWAIATARDLDMSRIEAWSDTRFERAHTFYQKQGFQHEGETRALDDGWMPYEEYFFHLEL